MEFPSFLLKIDLKVCTGADPAQEPMRAARTGRVHSRGTFAAFHSKAAVKNVRSRLNT